MIKNVLIGVVIAIVFFVVGGSAGYTYMSHKSGEAIAKIQRDDATALAAAQKKVADITKQLAVASSGVAEKYEQEKQDAEKKYQSDLADLRAGNKRLRDLWSTCNASRVSVAAPVASVPDAAVADREASAARIVRAARLCASQVEGLQNLLRSERTSSDALKP
jgi:hypothetical protein